MKHPEDLLARLLRTARESPPEPPAGPPLGFATRVAGRWAAAPRSAYPWAVWERLCLRAAGAMTVAALIVTVAVWDGWTAPEPDSDSQLEAQLLELLPVP
ncbi:MAG: hypothetical protein NTV51_29150 [Verrucomicrobia bacterium]|nr:hypothetical protein [Verrucomicrobiota bacterium]